MQLRPAQLTVSAIILVSLVFALLVFVDLTKVPIVKYVVNRNPVTFEQFFSFQNNTRVGYANAINTVRFYINSFLVKVGSVFTGSAPASINEETTLSPMAIIHPYIISYSTGAITSDSWNWQEDPVLADVVGVDSAVGVVGLNIAFPRDREFSSTPKIYTVNCTPEQTIILSKENFVPLNENVAFFDSVKREDKLYAFCEDVECNSLGKVCAVVGTVFPND